MTETVTNGRFKSKNLFARVITSIVLAPTMLFLTYLGGMEYIALILAITALGLCEALKIAKGDKKLWKLFFGITSLSMLGFCINMIFIRNYSFNAILLLIAIVWTTDIAAYFGGILIGGPKLAPRISPSKTISGSLAGIAAAGIVGMVFHTFSPQVMFTNLSHAMIASMLISLISQIGDLFESGMKRYFEVKDSGFIIPGHGGILDRFDGMIFASFAVMYLIYL